MKNIFVFLTTGFEEIEGLATIDILRRGGLNVKSVSLTGEKNVTASHGVTVVADLLFEEADFSLVDMLVLPGGTVKFNEHESMKEKLTAFANEGKWVAAICASPIVLGGLGLLKDKNATCYPGFEKYLEGAVLNTDKAVVVDKNIITGRGPALTFEFALKLVEVLAGKDKSEEVGQGLLI